MHEKRPRSLCVRMCLCGRGWRELRTGGYDMHQLAVVEWVFVEGFSNGENLHIRTRPSTLDPHPEPIHLPAPSTITVSVEGLKASPGGTMPHSASTKAARVSRNSACDAEAHRVAQQIDARILEERRLRKHIRKVASRVRAFGRTLPKTAASGSKGRKGREQRAALCFLFSKACLVQLRINVRAPQDVQA